MRTGSSFLVPVDEPRPDLGALPPILLFELTKVEARLKETPLLAEFSFWLVLAAVTFGA